LASAPFIERNLSVKHKMHASWKLWNDMWDLGLDAQRVIAMRLARISAGGASADAERRRMVSEKIAATALLKLQPPRPWPLVKGLKPRPRSPLLR
jgi:hypothetical protein